MAKTIKLDIARTLTRFPNRMRGLEYFTRKERRYLTGRMPADEARKFVDMHRRLLEVWGDEDNGELRALTQRRAELVRQLNKPYSLPADQLATADTADVGRDLQARTGAAELVRQIDNEIAKQTESALIHAENHLFARLVIRLADVSDDAERARILEDAGILSDESRRRFLAAENATTLPKFQQQPEQDPDRLTG